MNSRLAQKILCSVLAASVLGITANFNVAEAADEVIITSAALKEDKIGRADDTITFKNDAKTGVRGVVVTGSGNRTISGYATLNVFNQKADGKEGEVPYNGDGLVSDGSNLIVKDIGTVNLGTVDKPLVYFYGGQAILALNHSVKLENIGELNIYTNSTGIMAQMTGVEGSDEPSVSIQATGNVNIDAKSIGILIGAINENPGIAGVEINAGGKVTIKAGASAVQSYDLDNLGYKGTGKANTVISGDKGVDISSTSDSRYAVRVVRSNKLSDVGLTISAENGDVVIDGVAGAVQYDVTPAAVVEGVKGITGSITGNNVTLKSSAGSAIDILNNGNLTVASNVENGNIVLDSGNDVAIKVTGAGSILNLGSEKINNNITVNGAVQADNGGTVNLSGNATESSTGVYSVSNNGTVNFNTGNWTVNEWKGTNGNINVSENTTVNINNTITVNNAEISDGSILAINTDKVKDVVINAGTASLGTEAEIKIINSDIGNTGVKLFDDKHSDLNKQAEQQMTSNNLMQTVGIDGDGNIVIGVADASEVLPNVVIGGIITGLTANNVHNAFFDDVLKSGDAAKASEALNSVANMGELAGVNHGTYSMSNQMTDAVADHLSIATHGEQDNDIWAHYIHNKEDIDGMNLGGIDGSYEAQYNGIVVGSDLYKNGKTTAGVALSYADGNINGSNSVSSTKNDAEYYGASLYGRIDNGNSAILGDISYMHSDNDITQTNMGQEITASADADAFSIGIRAEQAYEAGAGKFVPYAGIRYMHLGAGDYSNSLGMEYNADDQNLWLLPVGVTYSAEVQSGDWTVKPIAEVGYVWTMGDRDTDQTVSLNGAADTFGFETADSGSFIGRLGIEAEKADVTYGLSYEYQKGDTVKANKWMANLTFSF